MGLAKLLDSSDSFICSSVIDDTSAWVQRPRRPPERAPWGALTTSTAKRAHFSDQCYPTLAREAPPCDACREVPRSCAIAPQDDLGERSISLGSLVRLEQARGWETSSCRGLRRQRFAVRRHGVRWRLQRVGSNVPWQASVLAKDAAMRGEQLNRRGRANQP